jgi:hypothetical protein
MGIGSIRGSKKIDKQIENNLCKIYIDEDYIGTGFLCAIPFPDRFKTSPVLIANAHLFTKADLSENSTITICLKKEKINKDITITSERKIYINEKYDVVFIEILKDKDKDIINNCLEFNYEEIESNKKECYILQYDKDKKGKVFYGKITDVKESEIVHNCSIEEGWDEGPILLLENFSVIGIHRGKHKEKKYFFGTLLNDPIKNFFDKLNKKSEGEDNNTNNTQLVKHFNNKFDKNKTNIIFRECGKSKNSTFIIHCFLTDKVELIIQRYKVVSNNDAVGSFKYGGNEITNTDITVENLGIKNKHTIFVIPKLNN